VVEKPYFDVNPVRGRVFRWSLLFVSGSTVICVRIYTENNAEW